MMKRQPHWIWYLPAFLALVSTLPAAAQNRWRTDCNRLKLISVSERPDGSEQSLGFAGTCILAQGPQENVQVVGQITARAEAIWKPEVGELQETVVSDGPQFKGYVTMKLHCDRNPVLERAECSRLAYSNTTGWRGFDEFKYKARPVTMGRASSDEMAALQAGSTGREPSAGLQPPTSTVARAAAALRSIDSTATPPNDSADQASAASESAADNDSIWVVVPLTADVRIPLEDARIIAARDEAGGLRWAILGRDGTTVLRLFPEGSRTLKSGFGAVVVDWGGGVYEAGREKSHQIHLPRPSP